MSMNIIRKIVQNILFSCYRFWRLSGSKIWLTCIVSSRNWKIIIGFWKRWSSSMYWLGLAFSRRILSIKVHKNLFTICSFVKSILVSLRFCAQNSFRSQKLFQIFMIRSNFNRASSFLNFWPTGFPFLCNDGSSYHWSLLIGRLFWFKSWIWDRNFSWSIWIFNFLMLWLWSQIRNLTSLESTFAKSFQAAALMKH